MSFTYQIIMHFMPIQRGSVKCSCIEPK